MYDPQDTGAFGLPSADLEELKRDLIALAAPVELSALVEEMGTTVPAESQLDLWRAYVGVRVGSAWNGYTMARLQGLTREQARAHPATGMLLALQQFDGESEHVHEHHRRSGFNVEPNPEL